MNLFSLLGLITLLLRAIKAYAQRDIEKRLALQSLNWVSLIILAYLVVLQMVRFDLVELS